MQKSMGAFVRQAWPIVEPSTELVWSEHLDVMCDLLERHHAREFADLIINVPPRFTKSTLASVMYQAWVWTRDPSHKWLTSSHDISLATRDAVRMRRLVESEWYQERWPISFQKDENMKTKMSLVEGGHRVVTSTGAGGLGDGGDTVGTDDPHNLKKGRLSEIELFDASEWWNKTMSTRRNNDQSGRYVIMQRLHEEDLTGQCLKKGGYKHLCLPMRFEADHPHRSPEDWRTDEGELLAPARKSEQAVAELEVDLGSWATAGQLQQRPSPKGGGIIRPEWFRQVARDRFPKWEECDVRGHAWDLSFKGTATSDYSVGVAGGLLGSTLYLYALARGQWDYVRQRPEVRQLVADYPADWVLVEDAANGAAIVADLANEIPGLIPIRARDSKEARAQVWAPKAEASNIVVPEGAPWVDAFLLECGSFPNGKNDDQVDAVGHLAIRMFNTAIEFAVAS